MQYIASAMFMNSEEQVPRFGITGDLNVEAPDISAATLKLIEYVKFKDEKAEVVQCEFKVTDLDSKIRMAAALRG